MMFSVNINYFAIWSFLSVFSCFFKIVLILLCFFFPVTLQVEYIQYIKSIPSEEGRQAELALFRRHPDEAERILLQASPPLVYRSIKLNINLFRWNRALELALKHKAHVETVLAYRHKYLQSFEREETNQKFLQYFKQVCMWCLKKAFFCHSTLRCFISFALFCSLG
jgi:hypothetical protein